MNGDETNEKLLTIKKSRDSDRRSIPPSFRGSECRAIAFLSDTQ